MNYEFKSKKLWLKPFLTAVAILFTTCCRTHFGALFVMSWNLSISDMVKYRNHFVLICCQTINIGGKSRKVGVIIIEDIFIFWNFWHKMNTNESKYEVEIKCSIFF